MKNLFRYFLAIIIFSAVPLAAQNPLELTSDDGGPDTYVSLLENSSALDSPELKKATTLAQIQSAMMDQSAVIHRAIIHGRSSGAGASTVSDAVSPAVTPALNPTMPQSAAPAFLNASGYTPPPFNSLANDIAFIQHQIATSIGGLPQTFYDPSGSTT